MFSKQIKITLKGLFWLILIQLSDGGKIPKAKRDTKLDNADILRKSNFSDGASIRSRTSGSSEANSRIFNVESDKKKLKFRPTADLLNFPNVRLDPDTRYSQYLSETDHEKKNEQKQYRVGVNYERAGQTPCETVHSCSNTGKDCVSNANELNFQNKNPALRNPNEFWRELVGHDQDSTQKLENDNHSRGDSLLSGEIFPLLNKNSEEFNQDVEYSVDILSVKKYRNGEWQNVHNYNYKVPHENERKVQQKEGNNYSNTPSGNECTKLAPDLKSVVKNFKNPLYRLSRIWKPNQ